MKKALFAVTLLAMLSMVIAPVAAQITWSSDIRLTDASDYSKQPFIAVDSSNNIHITWYDKRDGNYEIYYTKLDNNGNTLVDDTRLTDDPAYSKQPSIAVDSSNNIHITWYDKRDGNYEIYYTKLDNNGNTLVDDTRLTDDPAYSKQPSIAVDSSNNIHITWYDKRDGNYEIYYTKLDNNGNTLVDDTRLTDATGDSKNPSITVDSSGNVHIAWHDKRSGYNEIYYTKLSNSGATLVDDTQLTYVGNYCWYSSIAVDSSGNVHIAWSDKRSGIQIYYTKLDNDGNTLVDDTKLTDEGISERPSIAVDSSDNLHIAWTDNRDCLPYEVYYTKLDNNGNTLVDDTRLTVAPEASKKYVRIAADSNNDIHLVWPDNRDGNDEIYYKKGSAAAAEPTNEVYFEPSGISANYDDETNVSVWANTSEALACGVAQFEYTCCCANVTAYYPNTTNWNAINEASLTCGKLRVGFVNTYPGGIGPGLVHIGDFTVHCCNATSDCVTDLAWNTTTTEISYLQNLTGDKITVEWADGGLNCTAPEEKPDLNVTEKYEEWVSLVDKTYNVTYTVKNVGAAEAGASNTTITIDGVDVPEDSVPGLAAGANYTNTVGPFTMSGENDTIKVCADNENVVAESDEANNCMENVLEYYKMPDLTVAAITPNCGYTFANESNEICAKIENTGDADAGASNARFVLISDGYSEVVAVPALAAGANTTVCVNDTTIRTVDDTVTITVTADYNGEVSESNETNNVTVQPETVVNNGYKGKRYTGGEDITTWKTFELNGNLLYSLGDSYYLSAYYNPDWTTYNASWTASDLPVPAGASIEEARLFVPYTWDKKDVIPDNVSIAFNGNAQTLDAHYCDEKMHATSYPYGMLTYNVTGDFNTGGNVANLTNSYSGGNNVSIRGMLLVVIYANESEPERTIFVNEEFDLLYGGSGKCTMPEEATAYAPFAGPAIDIAKVENATLITVAPGADPNEGELLFNGHVWNDVWNFVGTGSPAPQIGIDKRDVKLYLNDSGNEAGFQSSGDYMEASNAFLVVTHKKELPPSEYTIKIDDYTLALYDGGEVTVPVEILNATDVEGGEANVTFNASVVNVKAVSAGNFPTLVPHIDNTNGFVHIAASSATAAGIDEAVLAYVVFEGIAEGETSLVIDDAYVSFDAGTTSIPAATDNGYITVEKWMLGDLNHNDRLDTGDATLVLRMVVGLTPQDMLGNMNQNGRIDTGDATIILRIIVGLPVD